MNGMTVCCMLVAVLAIATVNADIRWKLRSAKFEISIYKQREEYAKAGKGSSKGDIARVKRVLEDVVAAAKEDHYTEEEKKMEEDVKKLEKAKEGEHDKLLEIYGHAEKIIDELIKKENDKVSRSQPIN